MRLFGELGYSDTALVFSIIARLHLIYRIIIIILYVIIILLYYVFITLYFIILIHYIFYLRFSVIGKLLGLRALLGYLWVFLF